MEIENIIIEIGKVTLPALLTFIAGFVVGTINDRRKIKRNTYKDQLFKLYEPFYLASDENHYKYGAHNFSHLTPDEQERLLSILSENITYSNSEVYVAVMELRWSLRDESIDTDEIFSFLERTISDEYYLLRKKLNLPKINISKAKRYFD